ncbi:MAG TPA: cache domain-containing protein [Usitatibacteraceae bacterium]|nr:cache domain-containing protein [Usitatibacteraceae bacterium]
MKRFLSCVFALLFGFAFALSAQAADKKGTAAEATAMVDKAIAHIKKVGKDKAFAEFSDPKGAWIDRDLYIVVYDLKGKVLAHGANQKMIGKDVIDLRDVDGKLFVKERVEMMSKSADAKGWQDYKFMNPVSRQIEPKSMYLKRHEDFMVGCGIYK